MADEKITGFDMISTTLFRGWSPEIISEFSRIIQNFYKLPVVEALLKFRQDVVKHVNFSPDGHTWDISPWSDELMSQLYIKFRDLGFVGTRSDMLNKVVKDIVVGDTADINEGYRTDAALNVIGWQKYWKQHTSSLNAHPHLRKQFQSEDPPISSPTLYFSNLFETDSPYFRELSDFTEWKDTEGAIVSQFTYTFPTIISPVTGTLFRVVSEDFILMVNYFYDFLSNNFTLTTELETVTYKGMVRELEIPFVPSRFPVVITYGDDKLYVRDPFGGDEVEFIHKAAPAKLQIHAPITQFGTGFNEWMYYPEYMSPRQRLFFIN